MTPDDYIHAARVPERLKPQAFGPWKIERWRAKDIDTRKFPLSAQFKLAATVKRIGFDTYTLLRMYSWKTMHLGDGYDVVMEDSREELQKHLPIWLNAKGKVLVTGLGLGCVVRGLLAKPDVDHITVVEIDRSILRIIGREFQANSRVTLVHGDALNFRPNRGEWFDYAWHDLHTDGEEHLQCQHARLIKQLHHEVGRQGAWGLPRYIRKRIREYYPVLDR